MPRQGEGGHRGGDNGMTRRPECFGEGVSECFGKALIHENCGICRWREDCHSGVSPCDNCNIVGCSGNMSEKIELID